MARALWGLGRRGVDDGWDLFFVLTFDNKVDFCKQYSWFGQSPLPIANAHCLKTCDPISRFKFHCWQDIDSLLDSLSSQEKFSNMLHFCVIDYSDLDFFMEKLKVTCTISLFFLEKKSEIWYAFTFFEKWKVKKYFLSFFSRNEKWNDFLFHSFREVKVKLKYLEIEIERWNFKKNLENSRETRLSLVTAMRPQMPAPPAPFF